MGATISYLTQRELLQAIPDLQVDAAGQLIARASRAVTDALRTAIYDVDQEGLPTDPDLLAAVREATLIQAMGLAAEQTARELASANPTGRPLQSATIGNASWTAASAAAVTASSIPADGSLCAEGCRVLRLAAVARTVHVHG